MRDKIRMILMSCVMGLFFGISSFAAGWITPDGVNLQYQLDTGDIARYTLLPVDGAYYGFDAAGNRIVGWGQLNGNWYYFDPAANGAMLTGWLLSPMDGYWYYLDPQTGVMQTGFVKVNSKKYYLLANGQMFKSTANAGTFGIDGYYYMTLEDGSIKVNDTQNQGSLTIMWDSEGKMFYRSAMTKVVEDSNQWLAWYPDIASSFDYETYNTAVNDAMQTLYKNYTSVMSSAASANKKEKRTNWENKVKKELAEMGVKTKEIQSFIKDVENGRYDDADQLEYYRDPDGSYDDEE